MRDGGADRETRREPGTESDLVAQVVDYAIFALAPDGTIASWNAGAERLKGYRAREIVGRSFRVLYPPEDRASGLPDRLLARAASDGRVEHEGWRQRRDGSRFWGDVVITARRDDEGRLTGFTKVTRDLTGRKQVEVAQDAFYAAFEHDFRAPVAALRGAVDALRHDDVPRARRDELLDRVEANADRLLAMAAGLVEYARTRSGESPVSLERLAPDEVARATLTGLEPADAARVRVVGTSGEVEADRAAIQRVLANLVANALRYSPADTPVEVRCGPGPMGFARIEVVDHGRGIAPEDLPQIFEAFERGRLADGDGSGLGLASVQALVARNGGRVQIASSLGEGTTVTVDLPLFPG